MQCIKFPLKMQFIIIISLFYEKNKRNLDFQLKSDAIHQISVGNPFLKIFLFFCRKNEKQLKKEGLSAKI